MNPSISPIKVLLGTIGYLLVTFPLAFVWHLVLFKETYDRRAATPERNRSLLLGLVPYCSRVFCCHLFIRSSARASPWLGVR